MAKRVTKKGKEEPKKVLEGVLGEEIEEKIFWDEQEYEPDTLERYALELGVIEKGDLPVPDEEVRDVEDKVMKRIDVMDEDELSEEMAEWFNNKIDERQDKKNAQEVKERLDDIEKEEPELKFEKVKEEEKPGEKELFFSVLIENICIGNRYRKDLGDIESLAMSISKEGLLHPVVVDSEMNLIAGMRRIEAFKSLGLFEVPCRVIDLDNIIDGEYAENVYRKEYTPSEAVAIAEALEPKIKEKAKERQKRLKVKPEAESSCCGNLPQQTNEDFGKKTRDVLGEVVGMSGSSLEKAREVIEKGQKDPDSYGDLSKKMDETGNVDSAYKEMKKREKVSGGLVEKDKNVFSYRKKGKYLLVIKFNSGIELFTNELLDEIVTDLKEKWSNYSLYQS